MVKVFEINGDQISGGTITNFSSTGIKDNSTKQTLIIEDDRIVVKTANIEQIDRNVTIRGDVKIYGILDAGFVRTTEMITNQRYEKQYLEFSSSIGTGLLWIDDTGNKQFVYRPEPNRLWSSENIDLQESKSYFIDGLPVVSKDSLGPTVISSNLEKVGKLSKLEVIGEVNLGDHVYYNPTSQRVSLGIENGNGLFSVYDYINNVEIVLDSSENGYGKIGTYTTKGLEVVTDNQTRLSITESGNVTIGHEYKDSTITRIYGKVGIGVKNPREQLEVMGNIRMGNRLFANSDAPPVEGSYQKGDIIWNSNPKENTYVGWICIDTGAPGIWRPFGHIAPQ